MLNPSAAHCAGLVEQLQTPEVELAIAAAVAAERERCSAIAVEVGNEAFPLLFVSSEASWVKCAKAIAKRILIAG